MDRFSRYITNAIARSFISVFSTLFILSSVVTLVRLADITSVAQVGGADFLRIFALAMPNILFYCLPSSFFISAVVALSGLSQEREMIAIFALGVSPFRLLKPLAFTAAFVTAILVYIGIVLVPSASNTAKQLLEQRKSAARLAIRPSEVGQKFGDWLVFVSSIEGANYQDVALFSIGSGGFAGESRDAKTQSDKIIYAKNATLLNEQGSMALVLRSGTGYALEDINSSKYVKRLDFSQMLIRQDVLSSFAQYDGTLSYWLKAQTDSKRSKDLADTIAAALFPLASVFWIVLAGVYSPRQQKNRSMVYAAAILVAYYSLILTVNPRILIWGAPLILLSWLGLSMALFKMKFERVCASRGC